MQTSAVQRPGLPDWVILSENGALVDTQRVEHAEHAMRMKVARADWDDAGKLAQEGLLPLSEPPTQLERGQAVELARRWTKATGMSCRIYKANAKFIAQGPNEIAIG